MSSKKHNSFPVGKLGYWLETIWPVSDAPRTLALSELEERILLSATPVSAVVVEQSASATLPTLDSTDPAESIQPEQSNTDSNSQDAENYEFNFGTESIATNRVSAQAHTFELVFIDGSVADREQLIADLELGHDGRSFEVVVLEREQNGIDQITNALEQYNDVDAIHVISHGDDGRVHLGNTTLSSESLSAHAVAIQTWGNALSEEADILFYGCDLASNRSGEELIEAVQLLTDADVSASDDTTGAAILGGDWDLEFSVGEIETEVAFSEQLRGSWHGLLNQATFQNGANGYFSTLDTNLDEGNPTAQNGFINEVNTNEDPMETGLIRFENIIGSGPNQIPDNAIITNASITIHVTDDSLPSSTISVHRMLSPWNESSNWDSAINGISFDDVEAVADADVTFSGNTGTGAYTISGPGLTQTVQAWANGEQNLGWAIKNNHLHDFSFASRDHATASMRPILTIEYTVPQELTSVVYLADDSASEIQRVNLDGTVDTLFSGANVTGPTHIEVDAVNGKLYWTDEAAGKIYRANIDGTGSIQTLVSGESNPTGLSINVTESRMYWASGNGQIRSADLDGNGPTIEWSGLSSPADVEIDAVNGKIYWLEAGTSPKIARVNLDGSSQQIIVNSGLDTPTGLAIDTAHGRIYWSDTGSGEIKSATLAGNDVTVVLSGLTSPQDVEIDPNRQIIYWTESISGELNFASIYGTGATSLTQGITAPSGFALVPELVQINGTDERRVNVHKPGNQETKNSGRGSQQAVAIDSAGNYVVVWTSSPSAGNSSQDGSGASVLMQRYDARGVASGNPVLVNGFVSANQSLASVAMSDEGYVVVVWTSQIQDGSQEGVFAKVYHPNGAELTGDIQINDAPGTGSQSNPSVDIAENGSFVVSWEGEGPGDGMGIFARRFDLAGNSIDADDILVNTTTSGSQFDSEIAVNDDGSFTVVWDDTGGVHFRQFNSLGQPIQGSQVLVDNEATAGNAAIDIDEQGNFVIVWRVFGFGVGDMSGDAVIAQRYDSAGNALGGRIQVSETIANNQTEPSVSVNDDGTFIITWEGKGTGDESGVFARSFNANGEATSGEFRINQSTDGTQSMASIDSIDNGNFVVVWTGEQTDGTKDVYARQFGIAPAPEVSIVFSTIGSPTGTGAPGLDSWTSGSVLRFGTPGLSLGGGSTSGTFSLVADANGTVDDGSTNIDSYHFVTRDITIGTANPVTLQAGDVLFSLADDETITFQTPGGPVPVTFSKGDVVLFSPVNPGQFTTGTLSFLFNGLDGLSDPDMNGFSNIHALTLVEEQTVVGDTVLEAGDILFARNGGANHNNIYVFHPSEAGNGTTDGTVDLLIDGDDINIEDKIDALHLVSSPVTVGGVQLTSGTVLVSVDQNDTSIGSNDIAVDQQDVFALHFTQTTLGSGTAQANAEILLDASSVGLDTDDEDINAFTLVNFNQQPVLHDDAYNVQAREIFQSDSAWFDNAWEERVELSFDNSERAEDLTDFPVLVALDTNRIDYSKTSANGEDLRFVDQDGTLLDYEIESWDPSGRSFVWVKVPVIEANSADNFIWMYYGNSAATDAQNSAGVWSNGYVGVWHLDSIDGVTDETEDSTGYGNHGDTVDLGSSDIITGAIGNAFDLDGVSEHIRIQSEISNALAISGDEFTLEGWVQRNGDTGTEMTWLNNQLGTGTDSSYEMTSSEASASHGVNTSGTNASESSAVELNSWTYLSGVRDGSDLNYYQDGQLSATTSGLTSNTVADGNDVIIGAAQNGTGSATNNYWHGYLDEVRISNVARSDAWTDAQYASMADAFVTYGSSSTNAGVLSNDHDPEQNSLSVFEIDDTGTVGTVTMFSDGSFVYDAGGAFDYLASGETATTSFKYSVRDGYGGSGQATVTLTVHGSNIAPVLDNSTELTLPDVLQGTTTPPGTLISTMLASTSTDVITDGDAGAVEGIAIINADNTNGTWQYSTNGTLWQDIDTVSDTNALQLAATSQLRFIPISSFSGEAGTIEFHAWDQTSGANATFVDLTTTGTGGETAFSSATETAKITVTANNYEPIANDDSYDTDEETTLNAITPWHEVTFAQRMELTFNNASRSENLVDFPVLVTLDSSVIDYSDFQSNGEDLRFYDSSGEELAFEIDTWNPSGTSQIWVKVPQIDANSNGDSIWMYFGNATAVDGQDPDAVWNSDYQAVYHLDDTTGGTGTISDSTGDFDGTNSNGALVTGIIGGSKEFDGTDDYIQIGFNEPLVKSTDAASAGAWVNLEDVTTGGNILSISVANIVPTENSRFEMTINNSEISVIGRDHDLAATEIFTTSGASLMNNQWHFVTGVVDYSNDQILVYVDGELIGVGAVSFMTNDSPITNAYSAVIGAEDDTSGSFFGGKIDELRISETALSADWINAEFAAVQGTFVNFGTAQTVRNVLSNDTDPNGDSLTVELVTGPSNEASFTLNADGSFTYTPELDFEGFDSFTYRVFDGTTYSSPATVTIHVHDINDAPTLELNNRVNLVSEDLDLSSRFKVGDIVINDVDAGTNVLTLSGADAGSFEIISNALFLKAGVNLDFETQTQLNVTIEVDDATVGSSPDDTINFTLTIADADDPPTLSNNQLTISEGETVVFDNTNLNLNDDDTPRSGRTITITAVSGGQFERVDTPGTEILTFSEQDVRDGKIQFVHNGGEIAPMYTFTATDGTTTIGPFAGNVTFTNVNDAPVINGPATSSIGKNTTLTLTSSTSTNITVSDPDSDTGLLLVTLTATNGTLVLGDASIVNVLSNTGSSIQFEGTLTNINDALDGLQFNPTNGFSGTAAIAMNVNDQGNSPSTPLEDDYSLSINVINNQPNANAGGPYTINEGDSLNLDGSLSNDPDGDTLTYQWELNGNNLHDDATGVSPTLTWTQLQSLGITTPGTHTIGLKVNDGDGGINFHTTTFTITNQDPIARNDSGVSFTTNENDAFTTGNVLANDSDPSGSGTLTVTSFNSTGTSGTVTDNGNGTFNYDPNGQFENLNVGETATDTFTYSITDGNGGTSTATVTITIEGVNDVPTMNSAELTISEGGTVTIATSNFTSSDPDNIPSDMTFIASNVQQGQFELLASPGVAITSFTTTQITNGEIVFFHNGSETAPAFDIAVNDGTGTSSAIAATINFNNVNDIPVLLTNTLTLSEGDTVPITTSQLDATDIDNTDANLSFTISNLTNGQFESTLAPGSAITTFTLAQVEANEIVFVHNGSENAPAYHVAVSDDIGTTVPEEATINFNGTNDPPTISNVPDQTINEDESSPTILVTIGDSDTPVSNVTLTATSSDPALIPNAGIVITGTGPSRGIQITPALNQFGGPVVITLTAFDGETTTQRSFSVTVDPVNDAPELSGDLTINVSEGGTVTITTVDITTTDIDNTDTELTYQVTDGAAEGFLALSSNPTTPITSFTQADVVAGRLIYVHNGGEIATDSVEVSVSDGAESDTATITIQINTENDAPTLGNHQFTITEGGTVEIGNTMLSASDVDSTPADLTFTITNLSEGHFERDGVTVMSFTQGDIAAGRIEFIHHGSETAPAFDITVSDGTLSDGPHAATINFTNLNDAPTINGIADQTIDENSTGNTVNVVIGDVDDPAVELTVIATSSDGSLIAPGGLTITGTGLNRTLSITPVADAFGGPVSITVTVSDGTLSDTTTFNVMVTEVNNAPVITSTGFTLAENLPTETLVGTVLVTDDPADTHTFSITDGTSANKFRINASTGAITTAANFDFEHTSVYQIEVTVSDNDGATDVEWLTIQITDVNDLPIAVQDNYQIDTGLHLTVDTNGVLANDSDVDSINLTAVLVDDVENGSLTFSPDGTFSYTANSFGTTDSFTYRVSDGEDLSNLVRVHITSPAVVAPPPTTTDPGDTTTESETESESPTEETTETDSPTDGTDSNTPPTGNSGEGDQPPVNPVTPTTPPGNDDGDNEETAQQPFSIDNDFGFTVMNDPENILSQTESDYRSPIKDALDHVLTETLGEGAGRAVSSLTWATWNPEKHVMSTQRLNSILQSETVWQALDQVEQTIESGSKSTNFINQSTAVSVSTSFTIGYVLWTLRGGVLLTSLLAQMPAWSMMDPLVVLEYLNDDEDDGDDESLESMIDTSDDLENDETSFEEDHISEEPPEVISNS